MDTIEELEDALSDILPPGFHVEVNGAGEIIVHTGLTEDEDGTLVEFEGEDDDEDDDEESDEDYESLDEDEDDDE